MSLSNVNRSSGLSTPLLVLRIEAAFVLAGSLYAYAQVGGSWGLFAGLILLPDLAMIGYLANPRLGAILYNLAHTYVAPALLLGLALITGTFAGIPLALIWIAHIGVDRLLGFGLKYSTGFKDTHLSRV